MKGERERGQCARVLFPDYQKTFPYLVTYTCWVLHANVFSHFLPVCFEDFDFINAVELIVQL